MNTTRLALTASLATMALWTTKAVAIGLTGGQSDSTVAGVLFILGLACCLVAGATTAVALTRRRTRSARIAVALGGVVVAALVGAVAVAVTTAVQPADPGWAWGEVNLWITMVLLVGLNLTISRRRAETAGPAPRRAASAAR